MKGKGRGTRGQERRERRNDGAHRTRYHLRLYAGAFAATRRYISSSARRLLFVYFYPPLSSLLALLPPARARQSFCSSFSCRLRRPRSVPPHIRADYALSFRNYFAYMPSHFTFSLSFSFVTIHPRFSFSLSFPSSRCYRSVFYKIYVCRRAGDVAAGYLFFQ